MLIEAYKITLPMKMVCVKGKEGKTMERGKKCFRKKRRMANSIFSWLLTFAIVVSSASTAPGLGITSLAAENEVGGVKLSLPVKTMA